MQMGHLVGCRACTLARLVFALRGRTQAGSHRSALRRRRALWGPYGVSRARVRRVPRVCAQTTAGAAAPASVPQPQGVFSPR